MGLVETGLGAPLRFWDLVVDRANWAVPYHRRPCGLQLEGGEGDQTCLKALCRHQHWEFCRKCG